MLKATTFQLYRRIRTGETGSTELPGYIQVNTVDDGEEYLIVYHGTDGYFLLNPSTSTTNMYAHCLKANGGSTIDGYNVTVTANAVGNAVVQAGLNTYNITVVDGDLAVTGVVKYDPVIYTHGDASRKGQPYMYCGSLISDGSQAGEKETHYTVNDSRYTITGIKCVEDSAANINYAHGKLSGTLHIADTAEYANYNKGETVTIETNSWGSARGNLYSTSAGDKIAGLSDNYKKASGDNCLKVKDNSMVSAYYYYDMSSDSNAGITRNNADGTSYSFKLAYVPMKSSGSRTDSSTVSFPSADSLNYVTGTGFSADRIYFDNYTMGAGVKQYQTHLPCSLISRKSSLCWLRLSLIARILRNPA